MDVSSRDDAVTLPVGSVQLIPRACWYALALIVLLLFIRSQSKMGDMNFWWHGVSCAHNDYWEGIYDRETHRYAFLPHTPLSLFLLLYPLGYLSPVAMRLVISIATLGAWWALYRFMRTAIPDKRIGRVGAIVLPVLGPLLAMLLAARFLANDFNIKQLNTITFAAGCVGMLLMLAHFRTQLRVAGCALLALSIGLKLITLPLLAMLIIKRAWWQSATVAAFTAFLFWGLPFLVLSPTQYTQLQETALADAPGMWLQIQDTSHLWSFVNFLAYRIYTDPWIPGTQLLPAWGYQLLCLSVTLLVGLPILRVMLNRPWRAMTPRLLWQEIALVGVAWLIIDPDGRVAHFVTAVPAIALIVTSRLESWHQDGMKPQLWQWAAYAVIVATTLLLVRLGAPIKNHFYMHYGLSALGQLLLYGVTLHEVLRARQSVAVADDEWLPLEHAA